MDLLEYIILFISVLFGGGIAFYVQKNNKTIIGLVLSLSGTYLLGITVLHLMPAIFSAPGHAVGFFVLIGFLLQLFLEQLSGGVEHGHIHASKNATSKLPISVMIGLCAHAFLEGIPLSNYGAITETGLEHNHLLYGIILHKAPAAFALVLLLLTGEFKKSTVLACLVLFAVMSPMGAFLSEVITLNKQTQLKVMAVVVGSFLHISTTIVFETDNSHQHKIPFKRVSAILVGIGFAALTVLIEHEH